MVDESKRIGQCARCHRALKDPVSVERGMGRVCWAKSMGDAFEGDLEATDEVWARREETLRKGGEIDLGCNWEYDRGEGYPACRVRVSLRYLDETGEFEAYGRLLGATGDDITEVSFKIHADLRTVYRAAVMAGPRCTAQAAWRRRQLARRCRARKAA